MNPIKSFLLATVLAILLSGCRQMPSVVINGERFKVELAITPEERAQGLMFRESLKKNGGMLFVFEEEQPLSFWMKNTSIALSIAYISANGVIIDILDMNPHDLSLVPSSQPVKYALEVNQGEFKRRNIRIGNRVILPKKEIKIRENEIQRLNAVQP